MPLGRDTLLPTDSNCVVDAALVSTIAVDSGREVWPRRIGVSRSGAAARTNSRRLVLGAATLLSACVYVPRTTLVYDHECKVMTKHLVLEGGQVAAIQRCENQGCIALIVGASVVTAATIVVSGSIVVVGNIAYWLERKSRCQPEV
jgi:hypothetical protein